MTKNFKDQFRGALLGLACGDALGTTLEFKRPGTFKPISDIVGGGPFGLKPGQWTDDTSMALCLAESLVESKGFDPKDQLQRYVQWWRKGHLSSTGICFDIGNATASALHRFEKTGEEYCGSTDPYSAGNGSIMRLAPVVLHYALNGSEAIEYSGLSSRTTHGALTCVDACRYLGGLIWGALRGDPKETLIAANYEAFQGAWGEAPFVPEIAEIVAGSFRSKEPPTIQGSGYVVKSLEAALWAFYKTDNFRDGALLAVNLGDDADTTGAVYGQIAGAFYGARDIPSEWIEKLALREVIEDYIERLYEPIAKEYDLNEDGRLTKRYHPEEISAMEEMDSAAWGAMKVIFPGQLPMSWSEAAEFRKKKKKEKCIESLAVGVIAASDFNVNAVRLGKGWDDEIRRPCTSNSIGNWAKEEDCLRLRAELIRKRVPRVIDEADQVESIAKEISDEAQEFGDATKEILNVVAQDWNKAASLERKSAAALLKAAKLQDATEDALDDAFKIKARLAKLYERIGEGYSKAINVAEQELKAEADQQ